MAITYKSKCISCKKNYVLMTYKQRYPICYDCQKKELEGKNIKEKNTGIHLLVCWNMLDKGLREMFFSQYFNTLAHWHVNPIEPKRTDLENIRLIKV